MESILIMLDDCITAIIALYLLLIVVGAIIYGLKDLRD